MYLSVGAFAWVGKCRSYGAQSAFVCVYPGFHFGLCPHSTLGYAGVSCLRHSLSLSTRTYRSIYVYLLKWVHALSKMFTCTYGNEYSVLTEVFTCTYGNEYDALTEVSTSYLLRPPDGLQKDKFHLFFCGALQNGVIARHWDWRRREFTLVNDQAWMSIITQRVPRYTMFHSGEMSTFDTINLKYFQIKWVLQQISSFV